VSNGSTSSSKNSHSIADYDAVFAAVDSGARRQILMILHFRRDQMTSGEIADRFSCAWATTSRHLRKLESSGLVTVERSGREWIYRLNRERLAVVAEWLGWFSRPAVEAANAALGSDVASRSGRSARSSRLTPAAPAKRAKKARAHARLRSRSRPTAG
jgi:DNA-binding transcriptional ArsR family regulator